MKRLSLLFAGLVVAATLSGCCCHRYNSCNPCGPCGATPCSPCGATYAQQIQPAYGPVGPVSYESGPVAMGNPGCSSCNNLSY